MALLAEDLLLLLLDDESGKPMVDSTKLEAALGGAVLADLALAGAVEVRPLGPLGGPRVVATGTGAPPDPATTPPVRADPVLADPVLAGALETVAAKPRSPQDLVTKLAKSLRPELLRRLADAGVVEHAEDRVLGVFPRHRWPAVDRAREEEQRRAVHGLLVVGLTPTPRTAALVALLAAVDRAHKTVPLDGLSAREVRRRAKHVAEGDWGAKAVRDAVAAAQAAVVAATAGATVATGAGN